MESVIKWQTGEPKEYGQYLVTTSLGVISIDVWLKDAKRWYEYSEDYLDVVIAWCPLSEIEPYKEENEEEKAIPPYMDYDVRTK